MQVEIADIDNRGKISLVPVGDDSDGGADADSGTDD
jgi:polyribonucleotide nucleotidyltransferase